MTHIAIQEDLDGKVVDWVRPPRGFWWREMIVERML
jgi:hypothetical protein